MRINHIIEACIDFIAVEGILGSDIDTLQAHLATLDPSIDFAYFSYIYTLLIAHPSIQVILTAHPLPPPNGDVRVGTAPVPADDITRNLSVETRETAEELAARGLKGRNLAFQLAGREFRSSKESVADKRLENLKARRTKKTSDDNGAGTSGTNGNDQTPQDELWRLLEGDDGGEGEDKAPTADLPRLLDKWGSRLRIRASDDEIYFRLVGTTQKNPRITPIVFHILQVTAKTRERGITTIDLGPAVGAGQGSLHYYMKVLTGLGLCAKLPTVSFSAMTNILVFHKFMEQNPTYQALIQPIRIPSEPEPDQVQEDELDPALGPSTGPQAEGAEIQVDSESSKVEPLPNTDDWGLDFTPLREMDVMTGTLVKDRLLQVLEHPNLKNHLLKLRELLPALGWREVSVQRHKRAFSKHVDSLIFSGVVEKVLVGELKTGCLRLAKYSPDYVASQAGPSTLAAAAIEEDALDPAMAESDLTTGYNDLFNFSGRASLATHLEYQVLKLIADSREKGMIIADLRDELSTYYKRSIEFLQIRLDNALNPPHLQHMNTTSSMENFGRERRLRCFTITAMRNVWIAQGQVPDDTTHPPAPPEAGHWQDVSFRKMYTVPEEFHKTVDKFLSGQSRISAVPTGPGTRRTRGPNKRTNLKDSTSFIPRAPDDPALNQPGRSESPEKRRRADSPSQKTMKYRIEGQVRGRPRKYIHVVTETGKIDRAIIGQVYPHPELAPIYVYLTNLNKLVIPPPWYSGLGKPPDLDPAAIADGKPPKYFDDFPGDKKTKHRKGRESQSKKKKKKAKEGAEGAATAEASSSKRGKSKAKAKEVPDTGDVAPTRKRKKKDVEDGTPGASGTPKAKKAKKSKEALEPSGGMDGQPPAVPPAGGSGATPAAIAKLQVEPHAPPPPPPPAPQPAVDHEAYDINIDPFIGEVLLPALRNAQAHNPETVSWTPVPIHPPMVFHAGPPFPQPPPHVYPGPLPPPHVYPPFRPPPHTLAASLQPPHLYPPPIAAGPAPPPSLPQAGPSQPAKPPKRKKKNDSDIDTAILDLDGTPAPEKKKRGRPLGSKTKPKPPPVEGEVPLFEKMSKEKKKKLDAALGAVASPNAPPDGSVPLPAPSTEPQPTPSPTSKSTPKSVTAPSTTVPPVTPKPRSPSPMIGSDFPEDKAIFSIPPDSEPREQHFLLPQLIRSYRKRMERQAASGGEDGPGETPGPDHESAVTVDSAHPSPTPLARQLPPSQSGAATLPDSGVQRGEVKGAEQAESSRMSAADAPSIPSFDLADPSIPFDDGMMDATMDDISAQPDPIVPPDASITSPVIPKPAPQPIQPPTASPEVPSDASGSDPATTGMAKRIADLARQAFNTNGTFTSPSSTSVPAPPAASTTAISPKYTIPPAVSQPPVPILSSATSSPAVATPSPAAPTTAAPRVEPASKMKFKPAAPRPRPSNTTTPAATPVQTTPAASTSARPNASVRPPVGPVGTPAVRSSVRASAGPHSADSPLRSNGFRPPSASKSPEKPTAQRLEGTPLREMTPATSTSEPRMGARGPVRLDLQQVRRGNEICEALRDAGGVLGNHKLRYHHNEWALRVAGTPAPFAPAVGYLMDRSTFSRTVTQLQGDGRLKETSTAIPTLTGRYVPQTIIYLSETPWEAVQAYIRGQSEQVNQALTPRKKVAQTIAATDFSILRTPDDASGAKGKVTARLGSALKQQSTNSPLRTEVQADMPPAQRRDVLLQDADIVGALYGYQPSRNVRCHMLHRAMVRALRADTSTSVLSTTPRVFTLPFLMEDLAATDWFSIIRVGSYSEELEQFLLDPRNRNVKMRDLPPSVKPTEKVAGHGSKYKFRSLLEGLAALEIIEPLVIADEANHSFTCDDKQLGGKLYLKSEAPANATYFRIYDFAPLFHFGGEVASLLAVLPIREEAQIDKFWDVLKKVSFTKDVNRLPQVQGGGRVDQANVASFTEVSDIADKQRQALTRHKLWRTDVQMHAVQSDALDTWVQAHLLPTDSDKLAIDRVAWEYALPRAITQEYIEKRREYYAKRRTQQENKVAQVKAVKISAKEKRELAQKRAEEELKQKLAERAARQKAEWESRVRGAAGRTSTPFSDELVRFVGRHTVQTSTINPMSTLTDAALDEACRIYLRNRAIGSGAAPGQAKPIKAPRTKAPKVPKVSAAQKRKDQRVAARRHAMETQPEAYAHITPVPADTPSGSIGPKRRRRKVWTQEDEEDLLDCEAIIRARSRDLVNAKGRLATERIILNVGHQTLLTKLKAQMKMPGKKAYFERLTDAWYDLWKQYRGTPELPDPNVNSITDFDIRKHLTFLRARIHKPSIRLAAAANPIKKTIVKVADLPGSVAELYSENKWTYLETPDPTNEILWNPLGGDDIRLTTLSSVSAVLETSPWAQIDKYNRRMGKLRTITKMIIAVPTERYCQPIARALLNDYTSKEVVDTSEDLCSEKILRKTANLTENKRQFAFQKEWLNAREGLFSDDFYAETAVMAERLEPSKGPLDWSLLAPGGEVAAMLDAVSRDQVDFTFDVHKFPTIYLDPENYNTRRFNDVDFEFELQIHPQAGSLRPAGPATPSTTEVRRPTQWVVTPSVTPELAHIKPRLVDLVRAAGADGISPYELPCSQASLQVDRKTLYECFALLARDPAPLVFWAGYDVPRLVAWSHRETWKVSTNRAEFMEDGKIQPIEGGQRFALPRQWIDIYGDIMEEDWRKVCMGVMTVVNIRAGISETALREKLSLVLDRPEANDVLQYLLDKGACRRERFVPDEAPLPPVEVVDERDGERIAWYPVTGLCWQ